MILEAVDLNKCENELKGIQSLHSFRKSDEGKQQD